MSEEEWTPFHLDRPIDKLMTYYLLAAALLLPGFFVAILPLYFKFHTLRYQFDQEGVRMGWGILFRREIFLTYARIQDIHVTRDLFERWLGLGSVAIQTASGSSRPEMTVVGLPEYERIRDFLYTRMRGVRDQTSVVSPEGGGSAELSLLTEIRDDLRAAARALKGGGADA